jgi:hypothetical protein
MGRGIGERIDNLQLLDDRAGPSMRLDRDGLQKTVFQGRRPAPIRDRFIKGPISVPWVRRASRLGVKALLVGLALWYVKGLRNSPTFKLSNLMVREWGIQPDAKRRALHKLEQAGLISIERRGKRSPQVTLILESNDAAADPDLPNDLTIKPL